jgi:hypothetical protein
MPDYSKSKIYRLEHGEMFYIGSTTLRYLCQRLSLHKKDSKTRTSKLYTYLKDKNWTEVRMVLIEEFPCETRDALNARETHYIEPHLENPYCLNSRVALPTPISLEKQTKKRSLKRSETEVCECGLEIAHGYKSQHITRRIHCERMGIPYEPQQLRSAESLARQTQRASERAKMVVKCECGASITYGSMYLHKKSKAHLNVVPT